MATVRNGAVTSDYHCLIYKADLRVRFFWWCARQGAPARPAVKVRHTPGKGGGRRWASLRSAPTYRWKARCLRRDNETLLTALTAVPGLGCGALPVALTPSVPAGAHKNHVRPFGGTDFALRSPCFARSPAQPSVAGRSRLAPFTHRTSMMAPPHLPLPSLHLSPAIAGEGSRKCVRDDGDSIRARAVLR